jgi:hypothetical protein
VPREVGEEFGGGLVAEASQAGATVVGDKGVEAGVAFGMVEKAAVMGRTVLRHAAEMFAAPAVEALDHTIGLRSEGPGKAVSDPAGGAEMVKGMPARRFVVRLALFADGKTVGELGAVVGENGVGIKPRGVSV